MNKIERLIKVILIFLFIGALFKMPYSYYEIMRFLGMVGFAILGYKANEANNKTYMILWYASALLINPFFKIVLSRPIWNVIDIIWIILLIFTIFKKQ